MSIAAAVLFLTVFLMSQKTKALLDGWGIGIWNDTAGYDLSNNEQFSGKPAIGWISSSSDVSSCIKGASYSLHFAGNKSDIQRDVKGKAWFGIGSEPDSGGSCQSDLPSLGWLDFEAGTPPPSSCPGDCHAAQWHQQPGGGYTGSLDGWAKITSMGDNGWVRLKGANYNTTSDTNGVLSGFAWNSGSEISLGGNSGLGWIKMDGLKIVECNISSCATKQLCRDSTFSSCDASFCAGGGSSCALGSDKISWTCSSGCGSVSCDSGNIHWVDPEIGACGSFNGNSICDKSNTPSNKLCATGTPSTVNYTALTAQWTCGNTCPGGSIVSCSASTRCGWIETNP